MKPVDEMTPSEINCELCDRLVLGYYSEFFSDAGKIQLLRLMAKRNSWNIFKKWISYYVPVDVRDRMVDGSGAKWELIFDNTGKLAKFALKWLREENR